MLGKQEEWITQIKSLLEALFTWLPLPSYIFELDFCILHLIFSISERCHCNIFLIENNVKKLKRVSPWVDYSDKDELLAWSSLSLELLLHLLLSLSEYVTIQAFRKKYRLRYSKCLRLCPGILLLKISYVLPLFVMYQKAI